MASIDVVDIRKAYCGHEVIHGVSVIAGLESITSGAIKIGNRVVDRLAPKDRDTAMVSQNYALYPHKTVAENMGFALKLRGAPRARSSRGCAARPRSWASCRSSVVIRVSFRADSASAWRWGAPSFAIRRRSRS
ncbi:MAG: hypothetical protein JO312_00250, partial [Hyphomicrobiales bacterium]|nr:hypothetical protein [Hyphomicrobiales bacterium]